MRVLISFFLLAALAVAAGPHNVLTEKEKDQGYELMCFWPGAWELVDAQLAYVRKLLGEAKSEQPPGTPAPADPGESAAEEASGAT